MKNFININGLIINLHNIINIGCYNGVGGFKIIANSIHKDEIVLFHSLTEEESKDIIEEIYNEIQLR